MAEHSAELDAQITSSVDFAILDGVFASFERVLAQSLHKSGGHLLTPEEMLAWEALPGPQQLLFTYENVSYWATREYSTYVRPTGEVRACIAVRLPNDELMPTARTSRGSPSMCCKRGSLGLIRTPGTSCRQSSAAACPTSSPGLLDTYRGRSRTCNSSTTGTRTDWTSVSVTTSGI